MAHKYKNDTQWRDIAAWGAELGLSSWGPEIVKMDSIHPNLYMGSRLSAQEVIDGGNLHDQHDAVHKAKKFALVCIASNSTCQYCEISSEYARFDMQDKDHKNDHFLKEAVKTADHIHRKLRWKKNVLVHCHAGRNRSALAILVYCARHTDMTYETALHQIKLLNSHRFPMQSTLQNNAFTSFVRLKWKELKSR